VYISFVRGTPLLVQIYVIFFGLPRFFDYFNATTGWHFPSEDIPPLLFALIAFTINTSAYLAETIRSALQSVDSGQMEAAHAAGLTTYQGLKRIVIPQAFVVALPSLGNVFLGLIKGTSLAYAVRVLEVLAKAKIIAGDGYQYLETYIDAAIIYWILSFIFERIFFLLENRLNRFRGEVTA
jgi:L-cystine transport system permease protein